MKVIRQSVQSRDVEWVNLPNNAEMISRMYRGRNPGEILSRSIFRKLFLMNKKSYPLNNKFTIYIFLEEGEEEGEGRE